MIHQEFIEAVEDSPVIAAVKDMEGLRRCFDSESKVVFISVRRCMQYCRYCGESEKSWQNCHGNIWI